MAFGFGFNKQKVLSAAEKYVQQGKLQNAIAEYEKVLKNDPKDLTVTNTVGDLYARLGENDKATDCFKSVGDAYASQGFTVKAIAMYKKISKLKPSLENVLKLAELFTQQGLFNDARAQYLQVAEELLKSNEFDGAVRIFQKILEMDPDNVNMRVRLAEVYVRLGKKNEAWQIFTAAAESMRSKGSLSGAEEILQRMLTLDPGNTYALLMQGKNLLESGDAEGAIASLQKIADLDSNPDGLRDLLKAYLQTGRLSDAGTLAGKLLTVHNDLGAVSSLADALMQAGQYENALQVYDQHADRLLAENSEKILENLHSIIGHVRENPASLEKLLDLFHKAGETTHITEVSELLAHASVQSGDLVRARDLYQKLAALEPHNPLHMKNYQQVVSQLGGTSGTKLITAEEAAVIVDELEATAPSIHQHYSDEVALAVRSALTDAELFISYNMPAKALGPLVAALPQAPNDLRLNQRLAALYTRAGSFAEAAICCRTLQKLYHEAGYPEDATRYGELADRYEERSSATVGQVSTDEMPVAAEIQLPVENEVPDEIEVQPSAAEPSAPWPVAAPEPAGDAAPASVSEDAEFAVVEESTPVPAEEIPKAEIDLSSEWEDTITVEETAPEVAEIEIPEPAAAAQGSDKTDEIIEEVRFYLGHGMPEQAQAAFSKLAAVPHDDARVAAVRAELESAMKPASAPAAATESEPEEITVDDIPRADLAAEEFQVAIEEPAAMPAPPAFEPAHVTEQAQVSPPSPVVEEPPTKVPAPAVAPAPAWQPPAPEQPAGVLKEFVADIESALGEGFLPTTVTHEPPRAEGRAQEQVRPAAAVAPQDKPAPVGADHKSPALGEFVADIEASLGDDFLKAAPVAEPTTPATTPPPAATAPPVAAPPLVAQPVSAPLAATAAAGAGSAQTTPVVAQASSTTAPPAPVAQVPKQPPVPAPPPAPPAKASPFAEEAGVDLSEMFGELKHDLEAGVAENDEDPETHYNLGIAFREMGLLDEAIGELQKACQAADRGRAFPQIMQAYTWLAQCFLEKGVPEAAVRWYGKALAVQGIDGETRVALNYELASAYETAGDKPSALKYFMNVYGDNIDYRDVAERIRALKS
jgi:tetratricopeptide (TPR) repeat protein